MKGYKLLRKDLTAHKGFKYEINKPIVFERQPVLCGENCLHFYDDPYLAMIFNPIHSEIKDPFMFECDTLNGIIVEDRGVKFGSNQLIITNKVELPEISLVNTIAFAILCSKKVYTSVFWNKWADKWLSGKDRTKKSAHAAYAVAHAAAYAAVNPYDMAAAAAALASSAHTAYSPHVCVSDSANYAAYAVSNAVLEKKLNFKSIMQEALLIK